ncbi:uncharacterized protein L201_004875 [Kwoniella dendrophila CBS 6074]|uniref:Zn(2)-C6 fungal-type domain-containing protein n=1 Tax=Kwoniella dendrophila CBS 6074 TaxID=1295534 RepID=A0AAX4JXK1_9TREE
MTTESEESSDVDRSKQKSSNSKRLAASAGPVSHQVEASASSSSHSTTQFPSVRDLKLPNMVNPTSDVLIRHSLSILSPQPRMPTSVSTLLNQVDIPSHQVGHGDRSRGLNETSSPSTTTYDTLQAGEKLFRSRSPVRNRHSFHTPDLSKAIYLPREKFRTLPLDRSRPATPQTAYEFRGRPERNLPHLSETSIGQVLSPRQSQYDRPRMVDSLPTSQPVHSHMQQAQEMQRSATYPSQTANRAMITSRDMLVVSNVTREQVSQRSGLHPQQSKAWLTVGHIPERDRSVWSQSETTRYLEGYNDALEAVMAGQAVTERGESNIPPPQQAYPHQRHQMRTEDRREELSLQSPFTHRRSSFPTTTNVPTPPGLNPNAIIHPPPASDYFSTAYHHSNSSPSDYPPAKRAKRQQISCFPCRERKLKCDGKIPCAQCSRRHIDGQCKYADRIRRRGRGKKVNSDGQGGGGESEEYDVEDEHPGEPSRRQVKEAMDSDAERAGIQSEVDNTL